MVVEAVFDGPFGLWQCWHSLCWDQARNAHLPLFWTGFPKLLLLEQHPAYGNNQVVGQEPNRGHLVFRLR
jgi:hypothetical protein